MSINTPPTIELPYPHTLQRAVLTSPSRFRVLVCGRRWGKTTAALIAASEAVAQGQRGWWVLPNYPMSSEAWRILKRTLRPITTEKNETERRIDVMTGGSISIKSGDNPDSLRGVGLDFLIVDEAAFIKEEVWTAALRPTLSTTEGWALLIGTPKGRNWFWHVYQRGNDPLEERWQSWQFPTSASPNVKPAEIEDARRELPESIFRQEYLAEFLEDGGEVFRNVRECVGEYVYNPDHRHVAGEDWGKSNDFTVIATIDTVTKCVAPLERFNQIGWQVQRDRTLATIERYKVKWLLAEHNSFGDPNIEALQQLGLPVAAFVTTNESKAQIIQALALAFERREITIPNDPVLIGELEAFEATRLPSGKWKYAAPEGMHDDCVIALALAWWATQGPSPQDLYAWV